MQPHKLSDCLYGMAIDGGITSSQQTILFRVLARYICKLTDGHVVRRNIIRYALEDYYYGSGGTQEKIETDYLIWRCVWDIIYNDSYSMRQMEESAKFFGVDLDDTLFVMDNFYQKEIEIIQQMGYNPRKDFGKFDPVNIINVHLEKRFVALCKSKLRFLYQYDPGKGYEDWLTEMRMAAIKGFRRYDGECASEEEISKKMYSCAYSYVMEVTGSEETQQTKRIEKQEGGYRRKVLSLDYQESGSDDSMLNHLHDDSFFEDTLMRDNLDKINKLCSNGVYAYLKELSSDVEVIGDAERLKKHNVSHEQVEEELRIIGLL